ncbi:unnamed protein product [Phytophthora lilii]|uniref:Unnamed protein product n=1 Tax=Phytophthora lilii TaxID=2077276 RepID=A0A9W6WT71_9STRA|nr:unnamed protein product [Phytophthora lilii]
MSSSTAKVRQTHRSYCIIDEVSLTLPYYFFVNISTRFVSDALEHQWKELAGLSVASNWPTTEDARDRLFHRMLKDQATLDDHDLQLSLVKNERYEALVASYWNAQRYYSARSDDDVNAEQGGEDEEER